MTRRLAQSKGYSFSIGDAFLHPGDTGPAGLETQSVATHVGGVAHGNFWVDWRDATQNPEKQKSPAESPE